MTITTQVGTQMVRVRARFADDERHTLVTLAERLHDLSSLMHLGYVMSYATTGRRGDWPSWTDAEGIADAAVMDSRVVRANYNSPLEVVVTVTSIAGAVTLMSESLLRLWRNAQKTRVESAKAQTQLMVQKAIQGELELLLAEPESTELLAMRPRVAGAARAALRLESLEVEPDYEAS